MPPVLHSQGRGVEGNRFNQCYAQSSPREQQSTGLLHFNRFDSPLLSLPNKKATPFAVDINPAEGNRFAFCLLGKIIVATSVCTGGRNCPPDCCIVIGSIPLSYLHQIEKPPHSLWILALPRGIDLINVSLGQALASNSPPDCCILIGSIPSLLSSPNRKATRLGGFSIWWSRGESNPCPKATWKELLRAQFVIYIPSSAREQTPLRNQ